MDFSVVIPLWKVLPLKITNVQPHVRGGNIESALNFSCRGYFAPWAVLLLGLCDFAYFTVGHLIERFVSVSFSLLF